MADYEARIAPFINQIFYVTGMYGTVRPTHTHVGIDIATSSTQPLYSMVEGRVIYKDYNNTRGHFIILKGNDGIACLYQHMREASALNVDDSVTYGTFVGYEGTTGNVTGLHLHLEMQDLTMHEWYFGNDINYYINPATFMGIPNETGISGYYNAEPILFTKKTKKKFKWVLYARKLRNKRIL